MQFEGIITTVLVFIAGYFWLSRKDREDIKDKRRERFNKFDGEIEKANIKYIAAFKNLTDFLSSYPKNYANKGAANQPDHFENFLTTGHHLFLKWEQISCEDFPDKKTKNRYIQSIKDIVEINISVFHDALKIASERLENGYNWRFKRRHYSSIFDFYEKKVGKDWKRFYDGLL